MKALRAALISGAAIAITAAVPTAAMADGPGHSASFTVHGGDAGIVACRDWGTTSCAPDSDIAYIRIGKNSNRVTGWHDTDGAFVDPHCTLTVVQGRSRHSYRGGTRGKWHQIHGALNPYTVSERC
jgi:hypothetical protein